MRQKLGRPSHGTVVAYLALFVALGGSAAANRSLITGHDIKAHSITSRELAPGAVATGAIRPGAVLASTLSPNVRAELGTIDGARIKDGTIRAAKLAAGAVTDAAIAHGTITGDRLAAATVPNAALGPDVTAGLRGWRVVTATTPAQPVAAQGATATCPAGAQVLGGGVRPGVLPANPAGAAAQGDPQFVLDDGPVFNLDGTSSWTGTVVWNGGAKIDGGWNVTAYAICAQAQR